MNFQRLFAVLVLTQSVHNGKSGNDLHPVDHIERVMSPDEKNILKIFIGMLEFVAQLT